MPPSDEIQMLSPGALVPLTMEELPTTFLEDCDVTLGGVTVYVIVGMVTTAL